MHQRVRHVNGATSTRLLAHVSERTVWEAGHFYLAKGPTLWEVAGWSIMAQNAQSADARMLFVDDVHSLEEVDEHQRHLDRVESLPDPEPTHIVKESAMREHAYEAVRILASRELSKRYRAKKVHGVWRCAGYNLESVEGQPLCLLYDLGLTWYKRSLGFTHAINVVPEFYENEQRRLLRLARRAMPDFELSVVLHDIDGNWRQLA